MSAIFNLFVEIEHHGAMKAHAKLIHDANIEWNHLCADYVAARKVIKTYAEAYPNDKYAANWLTAHPAESEPKCQP
jgi:hypothetical protein